MKIKCMLVDDEPLAIQALSSLLDRMDNIEITAGCNDALSAFQHIKSNPVDLLFLDIEMPELSGLDFIKSLKHPPKIILVTAYRDYALDAFDLDVLDYLLKPVSFERLLQALDKFYESFQSRENVIPSTNESNTNTAQFLQIKADKKTVRIPLQNILYIESMKDYQKIHTVGGNTVTQMSLKSILEKLPDNLFMQIHRSFIINLDKIDSFTSNSIEIKKQELPIGRMYRAALFAQLN